jgi:putative hemolysin
VDLALELGLLLVLIALNAVFAGSEIALVSLREGQLARLEEQGGTGRRVADLARNPNQFLATIQIGITLAGFLASAVAAVSLAEPLVEPLGFLGAAAEPVAVVVVTIILAFFTLVLGELAPKRLALQRAERWAMLAARPLSGLATVSKPVVWLLSRATDLTVRVFGGDPLAHREELTSEEVRDLVAGHEELAPEQRAILDGVFQLSDRTLETVMVPRTSMVALPADQRADEAAEALLESAHSRAPVYGFDRDDVLGVAHLRDLVSGGGVVGDHVRPPLLLPETALVLDTLGALQRSHQQMAIVVSEHGGVEGMVTVEDLLEEIVGEIYDEFDRDVLAARRGPDGAVVLPGDFPVHDLEDLGLSLPPGDYVTVAGLVIERLGRIPAPGDAAEGEGWRVEVVEATDRAVTRVRVASRTA